MTKAEIQQLVVEKARAYGINERIALAQIEQESAFNPNARSGSGAQGLAQFMPATAKRFGLANPFDPVQSMDAWGKYMALLLNMFNGRYDIALAGYNSGENRAEYKAAAQQNRAINWTVLPARTQQETPNYVTRIMSRAGNPPPSNNVSTPGILGSGSSAGLIIFAVLLGLAITR